MDTDAIALLLAVLEPNPHVMLCIKDAAGRYVGANPAFVRRTTKATIADVVGRRAADLFPEDLAALYDAQDRAVLQTGIPVRNQLEVIPDPAGRPTWYLTTKVLTRDRTGDPTIAVVSVDAHLDRDSTARGLRAAVDLAQHEPTRRLRVADLAAAAGMSTDRLERAMRRALGVSPKQFLLRARVDTAARLLATTREPIVNIAHQAGYYDQSQLTRQFKAHLGVTPGRYREMAWVNVREPLFGG
jgi:AraC-like DNA-binding protein